VLDKIHEGMHGMCDVTQIRRKETFFFLDLHSRCESCGDEADLRRLLTRRFVP
jgi:RNA polymerase-binding transcription factor DksA